MPIGSILGGIIGSGGAQAAGGAMGAAGQQAYGNAKDQIAEIRSYLSPWAQVGNTAEEQLSKLYGLGHLDPTATGAQQNGSNWKADQTNAMAKFFTSPGYDFRLSEGTRALDRSAASRGMVRSGAQGRAITDYAQNKASDEWSNYVNALSGLSSGGLNAVESGNNTAAGLFNNGNNALFQGEMGRANSYQNSANALASGISSGVNNLASLAAFGYGSGMFGGGGANTIGGTRVSPFGDSLSFGRV